MPIVYSCWHYVHQLKPILAMLRWYNKCQMPSLSWQRNSGAALLRCLWGTTPSIYWCIDAVCDPWRGILPSIHHCCDVCASLVCYPRSQLLYSFSQRSITQAWIKNRLSWVYPRPGSHWDSNPLIWGAPDFRWPVTKCSCIQILFIRNWKWR